MSELISGKEALIALANGEVVQYNWANNPSGKWMDVNEELREFSLHEIIMMRSRHGDITLRLKPRTITINGVEVPACGINYKPNTYMFILNSLEPNEYSKIILDESDEIPSYWWKSEEEIKQVVAALRQVFGGSYDN